MKLLFQTSLQFIIKIIGGHVKFQGQTGEYNKGAVIDNENHLKHPPQKNYQA